MIQDFLYLLFELHAIKLLTDRRKAKFITMKIKIQKSNSIGSILLLTAYGMMVFKDAMRNTTFLEYFDPDGFFKIFCYSITIACILGTLFSSKISAKRMVFYSFLIVMVCIGYIYNSYTDLFVIIALFFITSKTKLDEIVQCHFIVYLLVLTIALFCAISGFIEDFIIINDGVVKHSFGNTYPTDFAAGVTYLLFDYAYLKGKSWKLRNSMALVLIAVVVYSLTFCRTSLILDLVLAFMMFFCNSKVGLRWRKIKIVKIICCFSYPILAIFCFVATIIYQAGSSLWETINVLFNYRLGFNRWALMEYGLGVFGNHLDLIGAGWGTDTASTYFFVDCGYIYVAIKYGMIVLCLLCLAFTILQFKIYEYYNHSLSLILVLISVSAVVEPRWFTLLYNPFLFAIPCFLIISRRKQFGSPRLTRVL